MAAFPVPAFELVNVGEFALYAALAVAAGAIGVGFTRTLYAVEDLFDAVPMPDYLKPLPGGLALGALGLFLPQVFGVGYSAMEGALRGDYSVALTYHLSRGQNPDRFGNDRVGWLGQRLCPIAICGRNARNSFRQRCKHTVSGRRRTCGSLRTGRHGRRVSC